MSVRYTAIRRFILISLLLTAFPLAASAQGIRPHPKWWFGGAAAANLNWYNGTAQILNDDLTTPAPFHKGLGMVPYVALGLEYRPNPVWGGMLYVGYDDRAGEWNDIITPCGDNALLSTTLSYISIEPSLRIAPFSNRFYLFLGPRIGINMAKTFTYKEEGSPDAEGDWSEINETVVSGQIGIGYDIALSKETDPTQVDLSPFLSFHPYIGQEPRTVENWAVTTVRAGIILKVGKGTVGKRASVVPTPVVVEREVEFTVRAPKAVPIKRRVRETFPLRNYVFFEPGSKEIPSRYIILTKAQASTFKEEQLQDVQPANMEGRSQRQMAVYYNILNTLGDRMRRSPNTTINLRGSSDRGPAHGKARAEAVKLYLVEVFGIDPARITTEGRDKPLLPSEKPGSSQDVDLLRAGDQRVDIETSSPELAIQIGGPTHYILKPVQIVAVVEDPLDSHVFFNVPDADQEFTSWSLELTDSRGIVQRFGPFTGDLETIPGNSILGGHSDGKYKVVMIGQTPDGKVVRKESSVQLVRRELPANEAVRFSILFDFDESKTVAKYEKFLNEMVAPLIPANSTVVIHGYSDVTGDDAYNLNLSKERASDAQAILERALAKMGTKGVVFETLYFGEDLDYAPFANNLPEGRFYNRSVIIDIVPEP